MAVIKFHPDLEQQENEAELAEQLQRSLRFLGKQHGPVRGPDQSECGWSQQNSRRDFADGERLAAFLPEPPECPRRGDDDHPLDQNQNKMTFNGDWIHKNAALE